MEAYMSVIMEAFRDQFTATELLSYKEVLYEEAAEEWFAQRDPDEVDREDRNCIRLARQFGHWKSIENDVSPMYSFNHQHITSTSRELPLTRLQLDNLHDDREIDELNLDWITWQRDYAQNKTWNDSRTTILEAMQCKL